MHSLRHHCCHQDRRGDNLQHSCTYTRTVASEQQIINKSPTLALGRGVNDVRSRKLDLLDFRFPVEYRGTDPLPHWLFEIMSLEVVCPFRKVTRTFRTIHPRLNVALQSPKWNWATLGSWRIKTGPELLMNPGTSALVLVNDPMIPFIGLTLADG